MSKPRVTAIIDTYNHERFIEEAVVSVLEQDFPRSETEVIVVDDGSTDRTPEIVREFEPRLRLIRKPNGGQASAFNVGVPEATGDFIAFLDGDDWWAPNKLTRTMEAFEGEPELGLVGHGITLVYLDGHSIREVLREGFSFQANTLEGARLFRLRKNFLGTSRMAFRARILRQILPVPEALTIQADEYLFTLAAAVCKVRILPEPLFYYRMHDSNAFQTQNGDPRRLRRKQKVLVELARRLDEQLRSRGAELLAVRTIIEHLQTEADQLRLMLDGGWPWETVKTERKIYEVAHHDAPPSHRLFKAVSLLTAAILPPKTYYGIRRWVSKNDLYVQARKRWLPMPESTHVTKVTCQGR